MGAVKATEPAKAQASPKSVPAQTTAAPLMSSELIGNAALGSLLRSRVSAPRIQRACACGDQNAHGAGGSECLACREKRLGLQTKLLVNEPGDRYEQEAERVADEVMTTPARSAVSAAPRRIQRLSSQPPPRVDTGYTGVNRALAESGRPLDPGVRHDMEHRFGVDFAPVRVHTGSSAERSARDVSAKAYTVGHDVVFGSGFYSPETPSGRRLIAHELAHVVQQSSERPPLLQRDPQPGAGSDDPDAYYEPELELEVTLELLDDEMFDSEPKDAAEILRLQMLLVKLEDPTWPDRNAFDTYFAKCEKIAKSEEETLKLLGDADYTDPDAFPQTWADKLRPHFTLHYPQYQLANEVSTAWSELERIGGGIPTLIWQHGLPLPFVLSVALESFELTSYLGMTFGWIAIPGGRIPIGSGPLVDFTAQAVRWLHSVNDKDFIALWIQISESVLKQIEDGEIWPKPDAAEAYIQKRPGGVPPDEITTSSAVGIPDPLRNAIDPSYAERWVTMTAKTAAGLKSFEHTKEVVNLASQEIGKVDVSIAAEDGDEKVSRARRWGDEHGFYGDAIEQAFKDITDHPVDYAIGVAKEAAVFTAVQFIPVVDIIVDVYMLVGLVKDVFATIDEFKEANEAARKAQTAAQLQRAAAAQAMAVSGAARKVADAVAMHFAMKATHGAAKSVKDRVGGGAEPPKARVPDEPAKVKDEPAKATDKVPDKPKAVEDKAKEIEKAKQDAAADAAKKALERERLPDEPTETLKPKGEARVNEEGHCKICTSPCRYQLDMAREVLDAARKSRYQGYADNLFRRVQLLDDAMTDSKRRGRLRAEYPSRFKAAVAKLSKEVFNAHRRLVGGEERVSLAAAEELESFEAGKEHGSIMDDPSRYEWGPRVEKANLGTKYHEKIQDAVVKALPEGTVLTENTVQQFFIDRDFHPKELPTKSTGIDLYVIDRARGVVTPVDIINVAGGEKHVAKLNKDVAKIRGAFRDIGLEMAEPIEIEYVGKTIDGASASISAELMAFARPRK